MRALTPVFSVLMIVILSVFLIGLLWLFLAGTFNSLKSTGTSTVNESLTTISSCMKIESAFGNQVSIRNCGKGSITQNSLGAYLDDVPLNVTMSPAIINQDEVGTVTLSGLWNFNLGGHTLRITNPRVIAEEPVNAVLPDSCVLDLEFDEGQGSIAYDSSGNGNNGILNPNVTWTTGKFGSAAYFNGSFNYVDCGNDSSLSIGGNLTLMAWVKRIGNGGNKRYGSGGTVMSKYYNYGFNVQDNLIIHTSFINQSGIWNQYYTIGTIPDNQWNHVTVVRLLNGTNTTVYFYVNGIYDSSTTDPGNPLTNSYNFLIGSFQDTVSNSTWFNGTIDSVRIYNQSLTPDQIISLKPVSYD